MCGLSGRVEMRKDFAWFQLRNGSILVSSTVPCFWFVDVGMFQTLKHSFFQLWNAKAKKNRICILAISLQSSKINFDEMEFKVLHISVSQYCVIFLRQHSP